MLGTSQLGLWFYRANFESCSAMFLSKIEEAGVHRREASAGWKGHRAAGNKT